MFRLFSIFLLCWPAVHILLKADQFHTAFEDNCDSVVEDQSAYGDPTLRDSFTKQLVDRFLPNATRSN